MAFGLQKQKIGIVGLGLGYSLAYYLASRNHDVIGVDIDPKAISEPRLDSEMGLWLQTYEGVKPMLTTEFAKMYDRDFIFIFVSTPLENRRLSVRNVLSAVHDCHMVNRKAEYAVLSTLPIGGMERIHQEFSKIEKISYSPPMIKKHLFLSTFVTPPSGWQLFGGRPSETLREIFSDAQDKEVAQIVVSNPVAEAAKLCTNLMLATKVIVANSIGEWLGDEVGHAVCDIIGRDPRVGEGYFQPGGRAAGPCLPRDLAELEAVATNGFHSLVAELNILNGTREILELAE